jgi:hypothetical protein
MVEDYLFKIEFLLVAFESDILKFDTLLDIFDKFLLLYYKTDD